MGPVPSKLSHANRVVLSEAIKESKYDVTIDTNLGGNFHFDGQVKIHVDVAAERQREYTLHSKELHIKECSFTSADGKFSEKAESIAYNIEASTVTMTFKKALPKGKGTFDITYIGTHNDQMAGFYRSGYTDRNGQKATMVSTQFEALDARRCFPCVDEPARKAVFKATLIIPDGLIALSNMEEESNELLEDGKRRKVVFKDSPKMSTYLLAFVVGDFDYVEQKTNHGILMRVYTPPKKKELGKFALEVGVKSLDLYEDLFQVPYPIPKMDMIAIPEFAMGAMENWSLVTYREVDLLIDAKTASSQQKQRVASVVAHELAHQWFGNLVTMKWWDGLWLNEGFASWMQSYCLSQIFPEWSMWEQFVINDQAGAMRLDALVSSHPIQVPIKHAEEVEQVFDAISYYKGACVVRLINSFLGQEAFDKGLQVYMDRHKFANTETTDLWQCWEESSGKPVKKVMASWTEQMGFPVITVKKATWSKDCTSCTMVLEQKWFISDGSAHPDSSSKLWSIPLLATIGGTQGGQVVDLGIMDTRTKTVTIQTKQKTWIKLNGGQHVPLRINMEPVYDEFASLISDAILTKEMQTTDRAGILLDTYALTKAGMIDPGALIRLLGAYENENTMPVYSAMEDVFSGIKKILQNDKVLSDKFTAFGARIISKAAKSVGWDAKDSDGHLTTLLRASLIRLQAQFMPDDQEIVKEARTRFNEYAADPEQNHARLPSDIKTAVIKIVLQNAEGKDEFEKCLELIDLADTTQAKKEIFLALGHIKSLDLKKRTLDWCTSGALKKQDFFYPIGAVSASSQEGLDLAWKYLQDNFKRIVDMIRTASPSLLAAVVTYSCGTFASEEKAVEIEKFFEKNQEHPVPQISRKIEQIVENTRANAKFLGLIKKSPTFEENLNPQQ